MTCPACGSAMRSRSMREQRSLKPYRTCPDCGAKYTADPRTRARRTWVALLSLLTVFFSVQSFRHGFPWTLATFLSALVLLGYAGYTVSKLTYVEFRDE